MKEPDFPVTTIVIIAVISLVVAGITGALVAWKSSAVEHGLEASFEKVGSLIGGHPVKTIIGTLLFGIICAGGMGMQEAETDPGVLWVPKGALALDHRDYVAANWPSNSRPEFLVAMPSSGSVGENILTPTIMKALMRDYAKYMATVVDGDKVVSMNDNKYKDLYGGHWSYHGGDHEGFNNTQSRCFEFAPGRCGEMSILSVFGYNKTMVDSMTAATLLEKINLWDAAPMMSMVPGLYRWKDFQMSQVLGGIKRDASGKIISAELINSNMFWQFEMKNVKYYDKGKKGLLDPIPMLWDAEAVCILGLAYKDKHPVKKDVSCSKPADIKYTGFFVRSFSDEFGNAIRDDVSKIAMAYFLIIIYLVINLGKRDSVHSMLMMSGICLLCIGLAYAMANGLGGFFKIRTNPLNNNIPFLLLGLGVDDSFVLSSEFNRHSIKNPGMSIKERIALTARSGGLSILVTSFTDALAFLIGSSTLLPALSGFCVYAGLGVCGCFIFEIGIFLPFLAINAMRAGNNFFDCICCCKPKEEHSLENPKGCCDCNPCCKPVPKLPDNILEKAMDRFGQTVVKPVWGKVATLVVFFIIFVCGIVGIAQMKANFKVEWFFPENSYVQEYLKLNQKYFSNGVSLNVYASGIDVFSKQKGFNELNSYLKAQDFVRKESIRDWWWAFSQGKVETDSTAFWNNLFTWYKSASAKDYRGNIKWSHPDCNNPAKYASCSPIAGIKDARTPLTLLSEDDGAKRFKMMYTFREDVKDIFGDSSGKKAFPYTMDFLYWEELGIITEELVRNLIIAAGVISVVILLLIPDPRVAGIVAFNIVAAIIEVVGFAHFWGLTFNGVSTIYFLICIGLAVDYSAHVAHVFKVTPGVAEERALGALTRIGPSVFHALISTIMAVLVLGFSKSFVFEVFFKILFLVTFIAGAHGLWLLPVLLSLLGGHLSHKVTPEEENAAKAKEPPVKTEEASSIRDKVETVVTVVEVAGGIAGAEGG